MENYKCKRCEKDFKSYEALRKHVGRLHKINSVVFRVEYFLNGVWLICKCGCNEKVKWDAVNKKFRDYVHGHQSRVNNNWGHNPVAIEKSAETRRKQYAIGERVTWSKGKSVETDPSLQSAAKKLSDRFTPEIKKQYAERMSKMRKDGTIPTLYGKDSSRWQGGVSSIQQITRANNILYQDWKYPILVRDGFKCTQCSNIAPLHVHHDKETFSEIIKKVMTLEDYEKLEEFDRKKEVSDRVVQYHIQNKVSGVTLCEECHKKLHPSLNL